MSEALESAGSVALAEHLEKEKVVGEKLLSSWQAGLKATWEWTMFPTALSKASLC